MPNRQITNGISLKKKKVCDIYKTSLPQWNKQSKQATLSTHERKEIRRVTYLWRWSVAGGAGKQATCTQLPRNKH